MDKNNLYLDKLSPGFNALKVSMLIKKSINLSDWYSLAYYLIVKFVKFPSIKST